MDTQLVINNTIYTFHESINCNYATKFKRMVKIASRYDELVSKFDRMISRGNYTSKTARLALACKLMLLTGIRIGNEDSAEGYVTIPHPNSKEEIQFVKTYGLTTLLPEHCSVVGDEVHLNFLGKKHVDNSFVLVGDLAMQVRRVLRFCKTKTLFDITDYELTKFIKKSIGAHFMPKDLRTLRANMYAHDKLSEIMDRDLPRTKKQYNAEVKEVATYVSTKLNNTPSVCKQSYIEPAFWEYMATMRPITR